LDSIATARKQRIAPRPMLSRMLAVLLRPITAPSTLPSLKMPSTISPSPTARISAEIGVACRASADGGSSAPSRSAATGGTRVARRAGAMAESSAVRVPTASGTSTTVSREIRIGASGRPNPAASNSTPSSLAKPIPSTMPRIDASRPITVASSSTERSTCRRLAPSVRRIANSRVRWATVIENVLKMMKAPTSTAVNANASRSGVRKLLIPPATWSVCSLAASAPVCTLTSFGSAAATRFLSSSGLTPGSALRYTTDVRSVRLNQACASSNVVPTIVAPPIDETLPYLKMPTIVTGLMPTSVASSSCCPTLRCLSSASFSFTITSPLFCGAVPAM
jgi:hypothetical protein